jgi:hypothetical protein
MRPSSIKALLISNAIQFGMTSAIFFAGIFAAVMVAWGFAGFPTNIDPIANELKGSSLFGASIAAISVVSVVLSSLTAGYVAGRIAGRRPVLHGALSSCVWFAILISALLGTSPSGGPPHGSPDSIPPIPDFLPVALLFGTTVFGALGGFIARLMSHGRYQSANASSQYSKWWWLGYFGVQKWTVEERRARLAMGMSSLVCFLAAMAVVSKIFDWVGIEPHRGAWISAVLPVVFGLFVARPIASELYRDLLRRADENARKRLSGVR